MADKHLRLDSQYSIVGAFWAPGTNEIVQTGTLVLNEKEIIFTTSPEYKRGNSAIPLSSGLLDDTIGQKISVLQGFTQDGLCTLCDLIAVDTPGLTDHSLAQQIRSVSYRVSSCVTGMHIGGSNEKCINSARYTFSGLSDWFPKGTKEIWGREHITLEIPFGDLNILDFSVNENRIHVAIKVFSQFESVLADGTRMSKSVVFVDIENPSSESLLWYYETGSRLENLFSLLTGASLTLETFFIYRDDDSGHVALKRKHRIKAFDPRECVHCSADQLANAMAIWLSAGPAFRSVENLALGVIRKGKLFLETEFLSLAQSLEGVHRVTTHSPVIDRTSFRQVRRKMMAFLDEQNISAQLKERICASMSHVNDPSFASRLSELCGHLSKTLLEKMGIDTEQFISTVVSTRNFYTHAGGPARARQRRSSLSSRELFFLSQKMRCVLRGALLLYLGIPEKQFSDLLIRDATRWK